MAYYEDLSVCDYFEGQGYLPSGELIPPRGLPTLLAVGWLEQGHVYPVGRVVPGLVPKLRDFRDSPANPAPSFMGWHDCGFCSRAIGGSSRNILVPSPGVMYVAPGGIDHFIAAHGYQPPEIFVAAALAAPAPESIEYTAALRDGGWPEALLRTTPIPEADQAVPAFAGVTVVEAPSNRRLHPTALARLFARIGLYGTRRG
jgi:hypothetical protein